MGVALESPIWGRVNCHLLRVLMITSVWLTTFIVWLVPRLESKGNTRWSIAIFYSQRSQAAHKASNEVFTRLDSCWHVRSLVRVFTKPVGGTPFSKGTPGTHPINVFFWLLKYIFLVVDLIIWRYPLKNGRDPLLWLSGVLVQNNYFLSDLLTTTIGSPIISSSLPCLFLIHQKKTR